MDATLDISVVVPLYNEEESLPELVEWIDRVARGEGLSYEVILVDDGSGDGSWRVIENLHERFAAVRGIKYDLVSGWKKKRHDPAGKRWPSKFFNWTARTVSGIRLHDFNCGLKAYRRRVVKAIEVYGEMHRYIPILAKQAGFKRIGEKVVEHRARKYGHSKFGMERMVKGYLDLITVSFLSRFGRSPMYFFGSLGTLMFLFGGCTTAWVIGAKLYKQCHDLPVRAVTDQPLFYLSLLAVVLGAQLFLAGFLGELIDRNAADRNKYLIEKTLDNQ